MIIFLLEILETAETGTQFTAEIVAKHLTIFNNDQIRPTIVMLR